MATGPTWEKCIKEASAALQRNNGPQGQQLAKAWLEVAAEIRLKEQGENLVTNLVFEMLKSRIQEDMM